MTKTFNNKYYIDSSHIENCDYSYKGFYFITIFAEGSKHISGKIIDGNIILSETRTIVKEEWDKSFEIRTEFFCDAFIIVRNHLHAILTIKKIDDSSVSSHSCVSLFTFLLLKF